MTGSKNWQTEIGPERKGRHLNGSGSNPSVTTDGKNLYALFKSGNLACLDFKGKILWQKNLSGYGKDTLVLGLWHLSNSIQQVFDCGPDEKRKFLATCI